MKPSARSIMFADWMKKNVRVSHAFFEHAPDRVRDRIGDAGRSLEDFAAENSSKQLIIVGDAASMLEPGRMELGAWKEALDVWKSSHLALHHSGQRVGH